MYAYCCCVILLLLLLYDYTIIFMHVDGNDAVVKRSITLPFQSRMRRYRCVRIPTTYSSYRYDTGRRRSDDGPTRIPIIIIE